MSKWMPYTVMILLLLSATTTAGADPGDQNGPYSHWYGDSRPGIPDPGIPGYVGPDGDGYCLALGPDNYVNPFFTGWATNHLDYLPADQSIDPQWTDPAMALGPVTGDNFDIVSMGDMTQEQIDAWLLDPINNPGPGEITLAFDHAIANGPGPDFAVFENGFQYYLLFGELAYVEVSTDGFNYARFATDYDAASEPVGGYGEIDGTYVYNLAGKHANAYGHSWGTPFDLEGLTDHPLVLDELVDLDEINFVKVVDLPGSGDFVDTEGHGIYDAWVTWGSGGLDLEAVGVINDVRRIADFEDLTLDPESFWNGAEKLGGPDPDEPFFSRGVEFSNHYDEDYGVPYWDGFSYSNITDTETQGLDGQYNAIAGGGTEGSPNYAVAYYGFWYGRIPTAVLDDQRMVPGVYITNNNCAYYSMLYGDGFAKQFGGESGDDPDWFLLTITGYDADDLLAGEVEFYLADFRFPDNFQDYIVNDWNWVDLSSLGPVQKLEFTLSSSDTGPYGMNTPAYFALDSLGTENPGPSGTVGVALACLPNSGTLPLEMVIDVTLTNNYTEGPRTIAGRLDVILANGTSFPNWRAGHSNLGPGESLQRSWTQLLPAYASLVGENVFVLRGEDVTPSPYNQPPYPPSGDTSSESCTVTGLAP